MCVCVLLFFPSPVLLRPPPAPRPPRPSRPPQPGCPRGAEGPGGPPLIGRAALTPLLPGSSRHGYWPCCSSADCKFLQAKPGLGGARGEPGRSNQSQIERKKRLEKRALLGWGSPFHSPFSGPQHQGKAPAPPPAPLLLPCRTGIGWDYLRKKKEKRKGEGIRERAIESALLQLPGLPLSLSPLQQHQEPKLNPEQLFPSVQFPSLPPSHTRRGESPVLLWFPSRAQPLVSSKTLESPFLPHCSMQTGIAMGALQTAGLSILLVLLHSGITLASKAGQGKRKPPRRRFAVRRVRGSRTSSLDLGLCAGWRN